jgi:hypothetical protein
MSDLRGEAAEIIAHGTLNDPEQSDFYAADRIISMVLSEAIKAINANVSIDTGDRYNAIEDAICVIERLK